MKETLILVPSGHFGSGTRSAPHSILGYRNSIGYTHPRVVEIPTTDKPKTTSKNIENTIAGFTNYIAIGGDHSITYGILKALRKTYGKPFVVMFDAHTDEYKQNKELDCGNWLRLAMRDDLLCGFKRIGCRGENPSFKKVPKATHVHITIDLDVLEPKEYGWASNYNAQGGMWLDELVAHIRSIGEESYSSITADLVEYDAFKDSSRAGAYACSIILDELIKVIAP